MDDRFWYIRYFQQPGVAEAELERALEQSLLSIYYTLSADAPPTSFMKQLEHPKTSSLLDTILARRSSSPPGSPKKILHIMLSSTG